MAQCFVPATPLGTSLIPNNQQRGVMFNIEATNQIHVEQFATALAATTDATYEIYYKTGTFVGSETTSGDWTLVGSTTINPNNSDITDPTLIAIPIDVNVTIPAGQTYGFYLTYTTSPQSTLYRNGSGTTDVIASDANINIRGGVGKSYPFGTTINNRYPQVQVAYSTPGTAISWNGSSWSPSSPSTSTCATLTSDYDVATDGDITAVELTVNSGINLTMTSGSISLLTDFDNNGNAFMQTGGTFTMNGSVIQAIEGANTFHNLTINNSSGVSLNSTTDVTGALTLTNGELITDGNLTLKSTSASITGLVSVGSGSISGDVTVERFLDGTTQSGYRYFSSPVAGQTILAITDDVSLSGLGTTFSPSSNGEYNLTTPFPNIYYYDESLIQSGTVASGSFAGQSKDNAGYGWETPASTSTSLEVGKGYALQIGSDATLDFTGTLNDGEIDLTLSHGGQANSGWNLIGNPYPSPLDWNAVYDDVDNSISVTEGTMYVFDADGDYSGNTQGYNALTNMAVNSGSQYIAQGQGFFVRAVGNAVVLNLKNSHRHNSSVTFHRTEEEAPEITDVLRLAIVDDEQHSDEWLFYFVEDAEAGKDRYDALQFFSSYGLAPALMSYTTDVENTEEQWLMDARKPVKDGHEEIPLRVIIRKGGTHYLELREMEGFTLYDWHLEDRETNQLIDLQHMDTYQFHVNEASDLTERFVLHIRSNRLTSIEKDLMNYGVNLEVMPKQLTIHFVDQQAAQAQITMYNVSGQVIHNQRNRRAEVVSVPITESGMYIVRIENHHGVFTKKVMANP